MPTDVEVLTGTEITQETQDDIKGGLAFFNTFLLVFAGIALFVGAFIIFNTFSIIVTQRQKEMALLRAIGASSKQVMRSVMVEAFAVGAIASVAGLVAGIGVAAGLKQLLDAFGMDLPAGGLAVTGSTVITSIIVGTAVTLASAYFPARKAGKVPPIAAMRSVALDRTASSPQAADHRLAHHGSGCRLDHERPVEWGYRPGRSGRSGHLRRCFGAGSCVGPSGVEGARLADAPRHEDERHLGSRERHAQPEADCFDCCCADDRCGPRGLHRNLRRIDEGVDQWFGRPELRRRLRDR